MTTAVATTSGSTPVLSIPLPSAPLAAAGDTHGLHGRLHANWAVPFPPPHTLPRCPAGLPGTPRVGWPQHPVQRQAPAQLGRAGSGWAPVFGAALGTPAVVGPGSGLP